MVAVGKFALNLHGCPRESTYVQKFFDLLNSLLVKVRFLYVVKCCKETFIGATLMLYS